ncbi:MAG: ATP-dependent 6-phosphofructokinase [Deltaproteobacteria bacterium]|nr:ATP-dependent 6-phosphofructokinase [Deltaproteobacteria bacterium]
MTQMIPITRLGPCRHKSPLPESTARATGQFPFMSDLAATPSASGEPGSGGETRGFERAGPREHIFFDPANTAAGIVTCGGLSPGINNVIRTLVMQLYYHYGVKRLLGFRFGFQGLAPRYGHDVMELSPQSVRDIHALGGSILSSSRGPQDPAEMVDTLVAQGVNILFCIGGDGTLKGAHAIAQEALRRGLALSVIGVPKTIDNDIAYCVKTFGFETAFAKAVEAVQSAHVEAKGAPNGISIVKLMGRDSGFIAANTTLACPDVDFVLVPEVPFKLEGENGFLACLERLMREKGRSGGQPHAVIVVAEGAGQELFQGEKGRDASGNVKYGDIGQVLKVEIAQYFRDRMPVTLKYIEPSYLIRSLPANPHDAIFCYYLGDHVAHAAMSGRTDMMVGYWNGYYTHVPLELVVGHRKRIDPASDFWRQVLFSTGQPARMD